VVFPDTKGLKLISTQKALKEIKVRATCFMIVAHGEKKSTTEHIRSISVVDEYTDVFPDEILELPPSRDVILGAGQYRWHHIEWHQQS